MRLTNNGFVGIGLTSGFAGAKLQLANGRGASLTSPGHLLIGLNNNLNLAIDNQQIQARKNGVASPLFLNFYGGPLSIGGNGGSSAPAIFANSDFNVGIRTSTPASNLHILHQFGSITHRLRLQNENPGGTQHQWNIYTQSGGVLELSADGNIVGTFNPSTGAYTAVSDRRVKKDIENASDVLSRVSQLNVIKYHSFQAAPQDPKFYGLIAQDVEPLFPEVVSHNQKDGSDEDFYIMNYSAFGVLAIKAIQEQQQQINTLQDRIAKLEAALAKISSGP
jgi:hypothetical protein